MNPYIILAIGLGCGFVIFVAILTILCRVCRCNQKKRQHNPPKQGRRAKHSGHRDHTGQTTDNRGRNGQTTGQTIDQRGHNGQTTRHNGQTTVHHGQTIDQRGHNGQTTVHHGQIKGHNRQITHQRGHNGYKTDQRGHNGQTTGHNGQTIDQRGQHTTRQTLHNGLTTNHGGHNGQAIVHHSGRPVARLYQNSDPNQRTTAHDGHTLQANGQHVQKASQQIRTDQRTRSIPDNYQLVERTGGNYLGRSPLTTPEQEMQLSTDYLTPVRVPTRGYHIVQNHGEGSTGQPSSVLVDELGRLVEEQHLLHTSILLGRDIPMANRTISGGTPIAGARLQNIKTAVFAKYGEVLQAKVSEKVSELNRASQKHSGDLEEIIRELSTNHTPDPAIVNLKERFVAEMLECILNYIGDVFPRFIGHVVGKGSYFSGFTASNSPNYDYEYVLDLLDLNDPSNLQVTGASTDGVYDITVVSPNVYEQWKDCITQGDKLDSRLVLEKFHEAVHYTVEHVLVPTDGEYGGFLAPQYSGVRLLSGSVALQYESQGQEIKIILTPSIIVQHTLSKRVLSGLSDSIRETLFGSSVVLDHLSWVSLTAGNTWNLSDAVLQRHILQKLDGNQVFKRAKKLVNLIRENFLAMEAPELSVYYRSVEDKMLNVLKDMHLPELIAHLSKVARIQEWELFMLTSRAAIKVHLETANNIRDILLTSASFHSHLDPSLLSYCRDIRQKVWTGDPVLLANILLEVYISSVSRPSSTAEGQIVQLTIQKFTELTNKDSTRTMIFTGVSKPARDMPYFSRISDGDMINAYIRLVRCVRDTVGSGRR